jgi:hypothetical protein
MSKRTGHRCLCLLMLCVLSAQTHARIERDRAQVRAFRAEHPCPATGRTRGACPGWHVDHVIALCAGGDDRPSNMQWITKEDHRFKTLVDVRECRKAHRTTQIVGNE